MLSTRLVLACSLALLACGGEVTSSPSDGGPEAAPDVLSTPESGPACTGCSLGISTKNVDPNVCAPQLESTTTCGSGVGCPIEPPCSYVVEVPCADDGGLPDADADQCQAWCDAGAPSGITPLDPLSCHLEAVDGGSAYFVTCGGCGV